MLLTYAFIHQLIELLRSVFNPKEGLSSQRFALLGGLLQTSSQALRTLSDLQDLSPPLHFCILDNIQRLDAEWTIHGLEIFFTTARGHGLFLRTSVTGCRAFERVEIALVQSFQESSTN